MIIDFRFRNFRSFSQEQHFSTKVTHGREVHSSNFANAVDGKTDVLKTAVIYGANASGKSNVLKALAALQWLVVDSGDLKERDPLLAYEPFRLSQASLSEPTAFEIEFFLQDHGRFRYSVTFNATRILEEQLVSFSSRQRALVFERGPEDTWEDVRFGGTYKGGTRKFPFFENNSYLSKAGNSAASVPIMRHIYGYFRSMMYFEASVRINSARYLKEEKRLKNVARVLAAVDTGISSITSEERTPSGLHLPDEMPESLKKAIIDQHSTAFSFWHKDDAGEMVEFGEDDESAGTQRLFNLLPMFLEVLRRGQVVLLDEIEGSFHPHIVAMIVRLFNDRRSNPRNAQLIFTTHDTNTLSPEILRRDQIWFVQKDDGASDLYCLDEYDKSKVKPGSPFREWYGEGRFGGVPAIRYNKVVEVVEAVLEELDQHEAPYNG